MILEMKWLNWNEKSNVTSFVWIWAMTDSSLLLGPCWLKPRLSLVLDPAQPFVVTPLFDAADSCCASLCRWLAAFSCLVCAVWWKLDVLLFDGSLALSRWPNRWLRNLTRWHWPNDFRWIWKRHSWHGPGGCPWFHVLTGYPCSLLATGPPSHVCRKAESYVDR